MAATPVGGSSGLASTLVDEFMADLAEDEEQSNNNEDAEPENVQEMHVEEGAKEEVIGPVTESDVKSIAKLLNSEKLKTLMERITTFQASQGSSKAEVKHIPNKHTNISTTMGGESEDSYSLVVDANNITVEIGQEIARLHKYIKESYAKKFPELESLILNPLEYARVVAKIGNELDLTKIDLSDALPPATIMVVSVTATTTSGVPLPENQMKSVLQACNVELELDQVRKRIIDFVESRMAIIAPNLSVLVGSTIAAKLMSSAGGLTALSKLPSCSVVNLGSAKKNFTGLSNASIATRAGFIYEAEVVKNAPPSLRSKATRVLGGKVTLAARVDSFKEDAFGNVGKQFKEEIEKKIEKWQEPPPLKLPKPLVAPDDKPKKRRGGKRIRKIKQKYEMTDLRKQMNRIPFGDVAQQEIGDSGKTLGMLGIGGTGGKIRLSATDKGILKKQKQQQRQKSAATNGMTSSLAFTPVQGFELSNPNASQKEQQAKYFGNTSFINKK